MLGAPVSQSCQFVAGLSAMVQAINPENFHHKVRLSRYWDRRQKKSKELLFFNCLFFAAPFIFCYETETYFAGLPFLHL
jgi:hypothetical protein